MDHDLIYIIIEYLSITTMIIMYFINVYIKQVAHH
jgi:hypothetical protein